VIDPTTQLERFGLDRDPVLVPFSRAELDGAEAEDSHAPRVALAVRQATSRLGRMTRKRTSIAFT
jgi:hypothetical protein